MRVLLISKFPPIQGGASRAAYFAARELEAEGHNVTVLTNAEEVELGFRQYFTEDDHLEMTARHGPGSLRIVSTSPLRPYDYLPWANPYWSKLFGAGHRLLTEGPPYDVIVGWYLEPFGGVAAALATTFQIPLTIVCEGSDIGRLADHPDLAAAFTFAIKSAQYVVVNTHNADGISAVKRLGATDQQLVNRTATRLPPVYRAAGQALDLNELLLSSGEFLAQYAVSAKAKALLHEMQEREISDEPLVAMFGKVGRSKGTFVLLEALARLGEACPQLVLAAAGTMKMIDHLLLEIEQHSILKSRAWVLPPIPPWKIPGFIKAADIACFLENDFPITFHAPSLVREILASGRTLLCTEEMASKSIFSADLAHDKNVALIAGPDLVSGTTEAIRRLVIDPELRQTIGFHGGHLSKFTESLLPDKGALTMLLATMPEPAGAYA